MPLAASPVSFCGKRAFIHGATWWWSHLISQCEQWATESLQLVIEHVARRGDIQRPCRGVHREDMYGRLPHGLRKSQDDSATPRQQNLNFKLLHSTKANFVLVSNHKYKQKQSLETDWPLLKHILSGIYLGIPHSHRCILREYICIGNISICSSQSDPYANSTIVFLSRLGQSFIWSGFRSWVSWQE